MGNNLSADERWERAIEHEPSYAGRPRPIIPLAYGGAVRQYVERRTAESLRCSCCERLLFGCVTDEQGRCAVCAHDDLVRCEACGFHARATGCDVHQMARSAK